MKDQQFGFSKACGSGLLSERIGLYVNKTMAIADSLKD